MINLVFKIIEYFLKGRGVSALGGVFTFGGFDAEHCNETITYQPLSSATYWQFRMDSIAGGSYRSSSRGFEVISDTGTSLIGGPQSITDLLARALGGTVMPGFNGITGMIIHAIIIG